MRASRPSPRDGPESACPKSGRRAGYRYSRRPMLSTYERIRDSAVPQALLPIGGHHTHLYQELGECAMMCNDDASCLGFVDIRKEALCVFKSSTRVVDRPGKDFYRKMSGPSPPSNPPSSATGFWECCSHSVHLEQATRPAQSVQRIPRVIYQTFRSEYAALPSRMAAATRTWAGELNREYAYAYFSDEAMALYMQAEGHRFANLTAAYTAASTGAERCDLWRALLMWVEGGVYADIDTRLLSPLRETIRPDDDAVSGVGDMGDLHQWLLAYAPRHPFHARTIELATKEILVGRSQARPAGFKRGTSPLAGFFLKDASVLETGGEMQLAGLMIATGSRFTPGVHWDRSGRFSVRILPTDFFNNTVQFRYEGYFEDLERVGAMHWIDEINNKQLPKLAYSLPSQTPTPPQLTPLPSPSLAESSALKSAPPTPPAPLPSSPPSPPSTSTPPECARSWASMDAYVVATSDAPRRLIARVPSNASSGVSDHVTGIVSAFALAIATHRRFVIDWPLAREAFSSRLASVHFLSDEEHRTLEVDLGTDAPDIGLHDSLRQSMTDDERQQMVLANARLNQTYSAPTVVIQWRQGFILAGLRRAEHPFGRAIKSLGGVSKENAFGCLYRYLFTAPRSLGEAHARAYAKIRAKQDAGSLIIGVHIRTGDEEQVLQSADGDASQSADRSAVDARGHVRSASSTVTMGLGSPLYNGYSGTVAGSNHAAMLNCAATLEKSIVDGDSSHLPTMWIVATDSASLRRELVTTGAFSIEGREVLALENPASFHSSPWAHWKVHTGKRVTARERPSDSHLVESFARLHSKELLSAGTSALHEQWLLGEASVHVLGYFTGFGKIANAISRVPSSGRQLDATSLALRAKHPSRINLVLPHNGQCSPIAFEELGVVQAGL